MLLQNSYFIFEQFIVILLNKLLPPPLTIADFQRLFQRIHNCYIHLFTIKQRRLQACTVRNITGSSFGLPTTFYQFRYLFNFHHMSYSVY